MRYFTEDHQWLSLDGTVATVGITPHAQDALGDVVFVDLPAVGRELAQREVAAVVESVKAAADVYTPVSGRVLAVNEDLRQDPALANSDPQGAGWFFKLQVTAPEQMAGLMDEAAYLAFSQNA